jgi:hypothetical protein
MHTRPNAYRPHVSCIYAEFLCACFYFAVCSFLRSFCLFVLVFGRHLAGVRDGRSTGMACIVEFLFGYIPIAALS